MNRAGRYATAARRWARLLGTAGPDGGLRVSYGWDAIPGPGEPTTGGTAKFQKLAEVFPNHPADFTLLYLGSSALPRDLRGLLWIARRRRIPVVLNQDGVGYPAWAGERADEVNDPLRRALRAADHVLYQSAFCKLSADRFLGPPRGSSEILHNAVDVERFVPATPPTDGPVVLLAGDQTQAYRLELGLRALAVVARSHPGARLRVSGRVAVDGPELAARHGVGERVTFVGRYAQRDAPRLYQGAHVLLHTKVNDPCPNVVLEAMACGLPVVYPASGGTPELVGDAGVGVPHPVGWDRDQPPTPEHLADGIVRALADRSRLGALARARAVEEFPLDRWLSRHEELFAGLRREAR